MPDAQKTVIPGRAKLWLAPVGTAAPADETAAPGAGWRDVGYTTEEGLAFNRAPTFTDIRAHQSDYPIRRSKTGDALVITPTLQEWSGQNFKAHFGGGTVTQVSAGPPPHFKFVPPSGTADTPTAALLDITDGDKHYRIVIPKSRVGDATSIPLAKTGASTLPLPLAVEGSDVGDPWYLLTDDPAFTPA